MANVVSVNVYQINQKPPIPLANVTAIGFPTQGCLLYDVSGSPTRLLSTGISVYSAIQTASGDKYYSNLTLANLITAFG